MNNKFCNWVIDQFNQGEDKRSHFNIDTIYQMMIDLNNSLFSYQNFKEKYRNKGYIYNNYKMGIQRESLPFSQFEAETETRAIHFFLYFQTGISLNFFNGASNTDNSNGME